MLVLPKRPSKDAATLEARWREIAEELTAEELESGLWRDLSRAFQAEAMGRCDLVVRWLDESEATILKAWEGYEALTVLHEEVTAESVLAHHLLCEGAECWLDALELFRCGLGQSDRLAILELAEQGQRLLVALGKVKLQEEEISARLMAAWRN